MCGKVLPVFQEKPNLCTKCETALTPLPVRVCPSCHKPLDAGYDKPFCVFCTKKAAGIDYVISPFAYTKEVRRSILKFKFGGKAFYAESYAAILYSRLNQYGKENAFDAIVPVPISKNRRKMRGYSQTLCIAKALSGLCQTPALDILCKTKETPPQSTLSKTARATNLNGAIALKPNCGALPERILLIDDVYTTGTTVRTCAKILRQGGAKQIAAATVAMHLPDPTEIDLSDYE